MSSVVHCFKASGGTSIVILPFALEDIVKDWSSLRSTMARSIPEAFTRDEWAYLISFLDADNLRRPFQVSFGQPASTRTDDVVGLFRPRGKISIWLPGNVSLLGPLTLILLSLTGNRIRMKGATGAEDLSGLFLEYARSHLESGALLTFLENNVTHEVFERTDPRNKQMAAEADVRIAFGSDQAVESIMRLDHPLYSSSIAFADRQSEAWIESSAVTDDLLRDLVKVFAIYGQAGCTSPRRAVILGADTTAVRAIRDRVGDIWPEVIRGAPAPHIVSENIMWRQCAAAQGWDAKLAPRRAAVLACGSTALPELSGRLVLAFVAADFEDAIEALPRRIQTIGYGLAGQKVSSQWLDMLGRTGVERLVPIREMHHFGPVWDGQAFWRQAFDEVEVG